MPNNINNYEIYLTKMSKTFFDKAWFMSNLPENVYCIIDFGCADGSFMQFLNVNCPHMTYIGIDNDPKFQDMTRKLGFECWSSFDELMKNSKVTFSREKTCVVLSSVLHEIYSYGKEKEFWEGLKTFDPKYIAIRDMMFTPVELELHFSNLEYEKIVNLFKWYYKDQWDEFYKNWKDQSKIQQVIHFMLKYIYDENWSRQVKENYLSLTIRDLNFCIKNLGYTVDFDSYYKLPYLVNRWKNDFCFGTDNIRFSDEHYILKHFIDKINTHYKMLLVKDK